VKMMRILWSVEAMTRLVGMCRCIVIYPHDVVADKTVTG